MNNRNPKENLNLMRTAKKLSLSAFVVMTFIAYALHKPSSNPAGSLGLALQGSGNGDATATPQPSTPTTPPNPGAPANIASTATGAATLAEFPTPTTAVTLPPVIPPTNTAVQASGYRDGTYTGPEVDAIYGLVQVQAVVQNGKITNVQFLEYPNDRRTSVRINSIAVPDLQQEAIQAQSANVDLITGATLTSQAFQMSLQGALGKAKGAL